MRSNPRLPGRPFPLIHDTPKGPVWAIQCGHPSCYATYRSKPKHTLRIFEDLALAKGWALGAVNLCPRHAKNTPGKETR